ncbi:hypothetical protein P7C71_g297, partial [Lecanoromycetidae sp. Uapishka_2]
MSSFTADKSFDLQYSLPIEPMTIKETPNFDINAESNLDDELGFFSSGMAADASPYIKDEHESEDFSLFSFPQQGGHNMSVGQHFGHASAGNVNPSDLAMPEGTYGQYNTGSQQNMSSSFNYGHSGINDDELLDLDLNDGASGQHNFQNSLPNYVAHGHGQSYYSNSGHPAANSQLNHMYSNTPDGAPIQSPFTHGNFNYAHFSQLQQARPNPLNSQNGQMHNRSSSYMAPSMDRQHSDSRSPMTPKTPGLNALHLGTPESGSLPSQPIHTNLAQRHQNRLSGQLDSTPNSSSYLDSPMTSPVHAASHAQISDILKSGKHASLPAKVESGHHAPGYQTQEAKRRRRRESHNMVERRRRDNINEKIQELSHLVPMHRLEDEKVRKHIMNNSPLSPTLGATGRSPEQATSLLAAGGRRAATGSISMGIPPEEKDKGPNKGDILNGAVSWTRDLMWALHVKLQQESELADIITQLGGTFPYAQSEDDRRMRTELTNAMRDNDANTFSYSRGPGSGLRVPEHTDATGAPLDQANMGIRSPQSLSPGQQSGESGQGHHQYGSWNPSFKEEDEYGMDMN